MQTFYKSFAKNLVGHSDIYLNLALSPYKERNCDREYCENNSCAESSLASSQELNQRNTVGKSEGDLKGMFLFER